MNNNDTYSLDNAEGGVCAPAGFSAGGICCGIKAGRIKNDLALIVSDRDCTAAAVLTRNLVKADPVKLTAGRVAAARNGGAAVRAVVANSGNANACTGRQGAENAARMAASAARELGIGESSVLVCSTGVIGQQLDIVAVERVLGRLVASVSRNGNAAAREAIMTTDTRYKEAAVRTEIGGRIVTIGTMAKGSGMIHINMGTMLGFITTDCAISAGMLDAALRESADATYNCVSVDGDTSTNDTLLVLANGAAGNAVIDEKNGDYYCFLAALNDVNTRMAKKIAADGEGAEHLIECVVREAPAAASARRIAKSVISSNLVKAAFFGRDANWGRVLCAMGYSGEQFDSARTGVRFLSSAGTVDVFREGTPLAFDEELARKVLSEDEVTVDITLGSGTSDGKAWGCDLTYEYVKINGDYRT